MIRHYNSAIRKYEGLGPSFTQAASDCGKLRDGLHVTRHQNLGLWSSSLDPSNRATQVGNLGEQALDDGDIETATRYFEELVDVARRDQRPDLMAQASLRLAWTCERESLRKLSSARDRYIEALEYAKKANAAPNKRIIEDALKSLEQILEILRSLCDA